MSWAPTCKQRFALYSDVFDVPLQPGDVTSSVQVVCQEFFRLGEVPQDPDRATFSQSDTMLSNPFAIPNNQLGKTAKNLLALTHAQRDSALAKLEQRQNDIMFFTFTEAARHADDVRAL